MNIQDRPFVVVTGASRGFGRAFCTELGRVLKNDGCGARFVLLSRDAGGMETTKSAILQLAPETDVRCFTIDLSDASAMESCFDQVMVLCEEGNFQTALLVNNAGSASPDAWCRDLTKPSELSAYFGLNLISVFAITACFLQHTTHFSGRRAVVNVSSLLALQPCSGLTLYCTGKAARDMMHAVLALEEENTRVLNYAPGPMMTDMLSEIATNIVSEDTRAQFRELSEQGRALDPAISARKLVRVLAENMYLSGAHVDYFDSE